MYVYLLFDVVFVVSASGCKFSLEEERVVIELQEQFGNRWAKIASYLSGRTDNDVKNFWSSRKKRLARVHKTTSTSSKTTTSKSHKNKAKVIPTFLEFNMLSLYIFLSLSLLSLGFSLFTSITKHNTI